MYVTLPGGATRLENAYVEVYDSGSNFYDVAWTDSQGVLELWYIPEDTYTFQIDPRVATNILDPGRYLQTSVNVTADYLQSTYDSMYGGNVQTESVEVDEAPRVVELQVYSPESGNLTLPDRTQPVAGLMIDFYPIDPQNTNPPISGTTNSNGTVFLGLTPETEGTYGVSIYDQSSNFHYEEITLVAETSTDPIEMVFAVPTRIVELRVYEARNGDPNQPDITKPVADLWVDAFPIDATNSGPFVNTRTDSLGIAPMGFYADTTGRYGISVWGDGISSTFFEHDFVAEASTAPITIGVVKADRSLSIELVNSSDDSPFPAPQDYGANIYCHKDDGINLLYFDGYVEPGQSQATVSVVDGGVYTCSAWVGEEYPASEVRIDLDSQQSQTVSIPVLQAESSVTFRVLNQNGERVQDQFEVSIWTDPFASTGDSNGGVNHYGWGVSENQEVTIPTISGQTYYGHIRFPSPSEDMPLTFTEESLLMEPGAINPIVAPASGNNTVHNVTAKQADGFVEVILYGIDGRPVSGGYAFAHAPLQDIDETGETPPPTGGGDIIVDRNLDALGTALIPVIAGKTYFFNAGPYFEADEFPENIIFPPGQEFIYELGTGTPQLEFFLTEPNYTLTVKSSFPNGVDTGGIDFIGCHAETSSGTASFVERFEVGDLKVQLSVNRRDPQIFVGGCYAIIEGADHTVGEEYFQEFTFRPRANTRTGTIEITFQEAQEFFPEETETFQLDEGKTFTFGDESTRLITPPGAFGANGQGSIKVGSATGYHAVGNKRPLSVWNITPRNGNNEIVEIPDKPAQLCFKVNPERLKKFNASAESLVISRYDPKKKEWFPKATSLITDETTGEQSVCALIDHFSIWGNIVDVIREGRSRGPTALKFRPPKASKKKSAKKIKKSGSRWTILFEPPTGALATTPYEFQYSSTNSKKKCEKTTEFKKSARLEETERFRIKASTSRGLCGRLRVVGGQTWSEVTFKKAKKKKKKK